MQLKEEIISNNFVKWRFDVNTFRLLGRDLITDRITALFELVKNCYDANSTRVDIIFDNVTLKSHTSKITIADDGTGMSFADIENKWMVVGTASKRGELFSPPPFNRRYVGEKGIGRFAVDKLGAHLRIKTKQKIDNRLLVVDINWDDYEKIPKNDQINLFTEVNNYYFYEDDDNNNQGTKLIITSINESWSRMDMLRLERELAKIVSPFRPLNPSFKIFLTSNEYPEYDHKEVKSDPVSFASEHISLKFDTSKDIQEVLKFDKIAEKITTQEVPIKSFGPISLELYYFNEEAKKKYNSTYKNDNSRIDGIKIYRDGLVTTPFAEFESQRDKKRDILGIDKRLWSGFLDKIGTREIIGILEINKELNPKIIDATNRQDFVDNNEYRELKSFIIDQLTVLSELKKSKRSKNSTVTTIALERANTDVKEFEKALHAIENVNPDLKSVLEPLREQAQQVGKSLAKGIIEQKKERKEQTRKENIYLSLMSLQDYAVHISHAVRTSLGKVKRMAEFFKTNFPNSKFDHLFKDYSLLIYEEMERLNQVIDFMLSYAGSNVDFEDFNVRDLVEDLLLRSYNSIFEHENIQCTVEIRDPFILNANKKFFEDIFQNLISNSIKALKYSQNKVIKCTGMIDNDNFILFFSDNGSGINKGDEEKIFEVYYTTTADQGGAGIGLFIVKTRVESLNGNIAVVESEFGSIGATFKLSFPFKKI